MTLTLYINQSDSLVVNKQIEALKSQVDFKLLDDCDEFSPVLILKNETASRNANYIYIEDWNKYYYITDRTYNNNGILTLSCREDVLMTLKGQFLGIPQIITRSSDPDVYNSLLEDNLFQAQSNMQIQQKILKTDVFNIVDNANPDAAFNYILTTVKAQEYIAPTEEASS